MVTVEFKIVIISKLIDKVCYHCLLSLYSMFPKSTHETFSNKLYQTFKVHKRFVKPKLSRTDFIISHYAGEVSAIHNSYLGIE